MAASPSKPPPPVFKPSAAILAWLWPGLGHIQTGQARRGRLIMFGVLFLFLSGLLVGGLDCVDRRNDRLWFLAQALCGPVAFVADFANQKVVQTAPDDFRRGEPGRRAYEQGDEGLRTALGRIGLGRVNEMGTLFIALAGLMNLVVILDVLYDRPEPAPDHRRRRSDT